MPYNYAAAKQAGLSDQEINTYLASKGQTQQPQAPEPSGGGFSSLLPLIGAIGGSFLPGLGTIAGGALGAGAGTLFKQGIQGKPDLGEVAKETAMGGLGGVFGKVASPLFRGATKLLGGGAEKLGEGLGIRGLRLNPGQLTKFATNHGEDVGQFLKTEGALGKGVADIESQHLQPLQNQFNAIAKKSGLTIDPTNLDNNALEAYQKLIEAGGQENRVLADKVLAEIDYIKANDLAPAGFDIAKGDKVRQTFASKVNWNNPEKAAVDYNVADILRKTNIDTANAGGMPGLKEIGIKLSKYRDLDKYATAQENLGRGTMPMGITKWLSILAGGEIGGAVGGIPGAIAGIGANALLNNPKAIRLASRGLMSGGGALEANAPKIGQGLGQTAGQIGAQGLPLPGITEAQAAEPTPSELALAPDTSGNVGVGQQNLSQLNKIFAAMILQNPKHSAPLMAAYKLLTEGQNLGPNVGKTSAKDYALARTGIKTAEEARQFYKEDPNVLTKQLIPGQFFSRKFDSAVYDAFDTLLRLRTGAQANPTEIRGYMRKLGPTFGDSPAVVKYKLDKLESDLKFYMQGGSADNSFPQPAGGL